MHYTKEAIEAYRKTGGTHQVIRTRFTADVYVRVCGEQVYIEMNELSKDWLEQDAEIKRLREAVAWWAGEGQVDRPEIIEWKLLCGKAQPTSDEEKRITEISKMVRREHEDAPELRAEIEQLCAELKPLEPLREAATVVVRVLRPAKPGVLTYDTDIRELQETVEALRIAARIPSPPADETITIPENE